MAIATILPPRADALLGFDWGAAHRWEVAHPGLIPLARAAYASIGWTPLVLIAGLAAGGHVDHLRCFLAAYAIALTLTVALFALCPIRSAILHFLGARPDYMPFVGIKQAAAIDALRTGAMRTLTFGDLTGLVGFPSFHAASGVLFIWGSRPMPRLHGPILAVNVMMIAATPMEGGHYLVDVLGGLLVATLAAMLVHDRVPQRRQANASASSPIAPVLAGPSSASWRPARDVGRLASKR